MGTLTSVDGSNMRFLHSLTGPEDPQTNMSRMHPNQTPTAALVGAFWPEAAVALRCLSSSLYYPKLQTLNEVGPWINLLCHRSTSFSSSHHLYPNSSSPWCNTPTTRTQRTNPPPLRHRNMVDPGTLVDPSRSPMTTETLNQLWRIWKTSPGGEAALGRD